MPFYKSSLNMYETYDLQPWEDPRKYSDFLIKISEQEYRIIRGLRQPLFVCWNCLATDRFTEIRTGERICLVCGEKA